MGLAQGLYEGSEVGDRGSIGLITYMRTDSTRVADEALVGGRELIAATYGAGALPEKPNVYSSKKGAQDAHEAIRPTSFDLPPDAVRAYLQEDEWKLYKLIWDRFIASQMLPAVFDVTQVDVENGSYVLRASGKVLKSPGFLAVYRETPDEDAPASDEPQEGMLPALREGETLDLVKLRSEQKFTQAPAQYSEATLVKALEENGIGRPSTYATILSMLTDRDYVERQEGRFRPTQLGRLVNEMLQKGFHDILNEGYTAALEGQLDEIEEGKIDWKRAIEDFDVKFSKDLETAGEQMPNVKREGIPLDEKCPECGSGLLMRFGRYGAVRRLQQLPGLQVHPQPRGPGGGHPGGRQRHGGRGRDPALRELRPAHGPQAEPLRHLLRLHRLPGVQEHPQDRSPGRAAEADRRRLSGVRQGRDRREALPAGEDLLVLQPVSGLQVLPLEEAGPAGLPAVRRKIPLGKRDKAPWAAVYLQHGSL